MALTNTRRELLAWLFGLPAAATLEGCRRTTDATFAGEYHEPPVAAGHRLRDGQLPPTPATDPVEVPVLILGAGIAGLTAGWRLVKSGFDRFYLLDLESAPGGTSRGDRTQVSEYPWGAHYVPAPTTANPDLVELLDDLSLVAGYDDDGEPRWHEQHLVADPEVRVFFEGIWHRGLLPHHAATAADREQLARFDRIVGEMVDRGVFKLPLAASSDELDDLDGMTFGAWLDKNGFDAPMVRWHADYACRDDYGTNLDTTSAWYGLHYFAARRRSSKTDSAPFLSWPGGNKHVADRMAEKIGYQRIRPFTVVAKIAPHGDGRRVSVLSWDMRQSRATSWIAEHVIFAMPSFLRRYLIHGYEPPAYHPTYAPWLVANVHLDRRPRSLGFETAWDNVIHDSRSLGYVVATHQGGTSYGPTIWTHYTPLTGDPRAEREQLLGASWKESADAVVRELARTHVDLERFVKRVDLRRWGHAMVRPLPGTKTSAARTRAAAPHGPIHFAHTDLSGVALIEEAFFHGNRAAKEVLAALEKERR